MLILVTTIVFFGLLMCAIGYWIYEKLSDVKKEDLKDVIWYNIALLTCGFSTACYFLVFEIPIYILLIPIIAIIVSKKFEKNKKLKKILLAIMFISITLIGMYCYCITMHNNQFLKHTQYINGIRSMGMETTDVKSLIKAAIDNNKKYISKKVVVECKFYNSTYKYEEKEYTTIQELEWLLENIYVTKAEVYFDYDDETQCIETIKLYISVIKPVNENAFWEYIVEFNNDDANVDYIKDSLVKVRQKYNEVQKENMKQLVTIKNKPIILVYDVHGREEREVDFSDESEVNKIVEQLDEREYRLLIQTYNDCYKISIID